MQPKKEKRKESKVVKAKPPKPKKPEKQETEKPLELPNDIPGQTEIEKDFPEAGETPEIRSDFIRAGQHEEENYTSAMPEPVKIVKKPVDNSEQMEENARNTET